jgi:hypothetical protein
MSAEGVARRRRQFVDERFGVSGTEEKHHVELQVR